MYIYIYCAENVVTIVVAKTRLLQLDSELNYYSANQSGKQSGNSTASHSSTSTKVKSEGGDDKEDGATTSRQ